MSGIGYRLEIDGLRAVAVIPVILFHMGINWIPGGFIGVDVFFVISGFLITSIIKKELEEGTFSFRNFWARRVRRILPAMIAVTACTLAVTYLFVFRPEQQVIGKQALAALLSVANIYFWRSTGDYWGKAAEESPFLHAWSLSVEEQFYLFFPIAMWLIFRFRSRWLQGAIAAAAVGSLALFLWGCQAHPTATFYLLPTRVWELGAGCLLAVSPSSPPSRNSNYGVFATVGLCMVVLSYLFFDTLGGGLGLAVIGTALVISCGQSGLCNRLLSQRSMVHIGKLSYSLYLWHWPVLVLANPIGLDWDGTLDKVLLIAATYFLALGTYHLVERPTRRRDGIVPAILVTGILVIGAAFWMALKTKYYDTSGYEVQRWVELNCVPNWSPRSSGLFAGVKVTNPYYEPDSFSSGKGIQINCDSNLPKVVLFGDSHGTMWSDAIVNVAKQMDLPIAVFAMNKGESPFFKIPVRAEGSTGNFSERDKLRYDQMRLQALTRWNPELVIIAAFWNDGDIAESDDLLSFLESKKIPVLLLEDPPQLPIPISNTNLMQYLAFKKMLNSETVALDIRAGIDEQKREVVRSIAAAYSNVRVLPTYDLFVSKGRVTVVANRIPLYLDDDHVSSQGANKITFRLRKVIGEIVSQNVGNE